MKYVFHVVATFSALLVCFFLANHAESRKEHVRAVCDPQAGDNAVDVVLRRDGLVYTRQGILVVPDAGRPFLADACRVLDGSAP